MNTFDYAFLIVAFIAIVLSFIFYIPFYTKRKKVLKENMDKYIKEEEENEPVI